VLEEGHDTRVRAHDVGDVHERQAHLRRDVVGDRLGQHVSGVALAEPLLEVLVQPSRGLHAHHDHLEAARLEYVAPALLEVLENEVEQRRSGLRGDGLPEGGDRGFPVSDELLDDRRVGVDRGGWGNAGG